MERLTTLIRDNEGVAEASPDVYIAPIGEKATRESFLIAGRLRARGVWAEAGYDGSSLRSQLRKADRLLSRYVLILGDDELSSGRVKWKNLRDGSQGEVDILGIEEFLFAALRGR
jgi:histidyl-tRNA synthetase